MSNFTPERRGMICGSAEAENRKYNLHIGKNGKMWLVANQPNAGDNIYVEGDSNSDGFAGRTLIFPLVNGELISLKGPWHTGSESLYAATRVDVRNKHFTFGVIAHGRKFGTLVDVIYQDEELTIGTFGRIKNKAQEIANELNKRIYYYSESTGGSSCGPIDPEIKEMRKAL